MSIQERLQFNNTAGAAASRRWSRFHRRAVIKLASGLGGPALRSSGISLGG
jgi:hypothetical protein